MRRFVSTIHCFITLAFVGFSVLLSEEASAGQSRTSSPEAVSARGDLTSRRWLLQDRLEFTLGLYSHAREIDWMAERFPNTLDKKLEEYALENAQADEGSIQSAAWTTVQSVLKNPQSQFAPVHTMLKSLVWEYPVTKNGQITSYHRTSGQLSLDAATQFSRLSERMDLLSEAFRRLSPGGPASRNTAAETDVEAYLERFFDGGRPATYADTEDEIKPKKPLLESNSGTSHQVEHLARNGFAVIPAAHKISEINGMRLLHEAQSWLRENWNVDAPLIFPSGWETELPNFLFDPLMELSEWVTDILNTSLHSIGLSGVVVGGNQFRYYPKFKDDFQITRTYQFHEDGGYMRALIKLFNRGTWYVHKGEIFEAMDVLAIAGRDSRYHPRFSQDPGLPPALHSHPRGYQEPRLLWVIDYDPIK